MRLADATAQRNRVTIDALHICVLCCVFVCKRVRIYFGMGAYNVHAYARKFMQLKYDYV